MQENTRGLSDSITRRHWFYLRAGGIGIRGDALVMTSSICDLKFSCHVLVSPQDGAISPGMEVFADTVGDSTGSNRQKLLLKSFKIVEKRSAVVINLREKLMFTS